MRPVIVLSHRFVEFIPEDDELEERTLYISLRFGTATHKCCCGCGLPVVTPLRPTDWRLDFDGKTVSLYPSIGNWSFPCRSHYWIRESRVAWAADWSQGQIERGRAFDKKAKERYFGTAETGAAEESTMPVPDVGPVLTWWQRFIKWLFGP